MEPMVTNGDSGNIGAKCDNEDPLETKMIHWSYNGRNVNLTYTVDPVRSC